MQLHKLTRWSRRAAGSNNQQRADQDVQLARVTDNLWVPESHLMMLKFPHSEDVRARSHTMRVQQCKLCWMCWGRGCAAVMYITLTGFLTLNK